MTLTKAHLIDSIHEKTGLSKQEATQLTDSIFETIKQTLESGEDVLISGFGKFSVKEKKQRKGRNPATGDDLILRERRVVTFKCSGKLRKKINGRLY